MPTPQRTEGVIDGEPISTLIFIYMAFMLIYFLSQNISLNPINGNTTAINNISTGYNNLKWFLALLAPIAGYVIIHGWNERSNAESEEE